MSIKPKNKSLYPGNWKEISKKIIQDRGRLCEKCGLLLSEKGTSICHLTVHHKDRNPANNKPDNLQVLCPRCHFRSEYEINFGISNKNQLSIDL